MSTFFFKQLYVQSKDILKSSLSLSIAKFISSSFNLLFMIYAVNLLDKTQNGYFQYYLGYFPIFLSIIDFGLPPAIIKFLSPKTTNKNQIGMILSSALLIKVVVFVIFLFCAISFNFFLQQDYKIIFFLIFGAFFVSFTALFESIFVSFQSYKPLALWLPLQNGFRFLILLFYSYWIKNSPDYLEILFIFLFSPFFSILSFFWFFDRKKLYLNNNYKTVKKTSLKLIYFNLYVFLATIFAISADRIEIFFLQKYHQPEDVAAYGTTLQLFAGFIILISTLNSIIYPKLSQLKKIDEFQSFLSKTVLFCAGIAVFISPIYFIAEWIFELLFGNKYLDSVPIFKILYPNYLLQFLFAPLGIALFALGLPKILMILAFIRLSCGLILNFLITPIYGTEGAAICFFLGQVISWLILTFYFFLFFKQKTRTKFLA